MQVVPEACQWDLAAKNQDEWFAFFLPYLSSRNLMESDQHCLAPVFVHGMDFRYWLRVLTDIADDSEQMDRDWGQTGDSEGRLSVGR